MELNEFVEKFMPGYEWAINDFYDSGGTDTMAFYCHNFNAALQNYTEKICEKQREICSDVAISLKRQHIDTKIHLKDNILHAKQPKIEEL